jgi:isopenicillin N synthase-like dioxygenase
MGSLGPVDLEADVAIPIIDLEPIRSGAPDEALATGKQVYEAFRDVGFAYIRNHGVPQQKIDEAFRWVSLHDMRFPRQDSPASRIC